MAAKSFRRVPESLSPKVRVIVLAFIPFMIFMSALTFHFLQNGLLPIYGRLYRNAPVVETPYAIFGLLMAPPAFLIVIIAAAISVWTGRKFDPPKDSRLFWFQNFMFSASIKIITYVVPTAIILTTLALLAKGYSLCPDLSITSNRKVFWVNDERVCFKPDHYINDYWPCKKVDNKEVCIQVDGR
ncbi:hypothetical protein [Pseudomonas sp. RIT-PI-S]|uniref:hypothetical protein n=1 Tax=Pseudomonas sp. RIT-PI-S TaxID=3035295 RepID=UPI0021D8BF1B|nr:hypothetical protein [Pseudomonas sp. RIT-PI-S]